MNSFSVSLNGTYGSSLKTSGQTSNAAARWQAGDEVSAVLTERCGGYSTLAFDEDFSITVPSEQVRGDVGDTLTFRVSKGKDGVLLKQLNKEINTPVRRGDTDMARLAGKNIEMIADSDEARIEEYNETAAKTAAAVARIQRAQFYMSDAAGASVMSALLESGISLSKIDFSSFDRILHAVKKSNAQEMSSEEYDEAMKRLYTNEADAPAIAQSLHRNGLSVNDRNIRRLEGSWQKVSRPVSESTAEKLLEDESAAVSEITADDLYKASHSSAGRGKGGEPVWEAPEAELLKLFKREDIEANRENIKAARFLEQRDLSISKENIEKYNFLKNFNSVVSKSELFDRAAEYIAADLPVGSVKLAEIVSDTRRMAESQLKFTLEAAARRQDLTIDTEHIRQSVRDLVRLDEDFARSMLRMADTEDSSENVSRLRGVMNTLSEIEPITANVHPGIIRGQIEFNLNGIHDSAEYARARYNQAVGEYERFATVPSARYGDSIAPLRGEFSHVLEINGVDVTADNLRAAYILSRNSMDVTAENVQAVTETDAKINSILDNLHPAVAAQMIKDGLKPLEMHADQVLAYIKQFNREMGEGGTEAVARHIMELDDENTLDADTRERMVAVYRMLHVIQKDGAAALGLAVKQNADLTLGKLMELAKYYQNSRKASGASVFDRSTEEGHLERLSRAAGSIRAVLERENPPRTITRTDLVAERFAKEAKPEILREWIENGETDVPLEELSANTGGSAPADTQFFASVSPLLIHYLQSRNIPATPGNIRALQKLSRSGKAFADAFNEAEASGEADIISALEGTSLDALKNGETAPQLMARVWARLEESLPTQKVTAAKEIAALQNGFNGQNGFSVPIRLNGRISKLSLYVLNERALREDGAKVFMSLDTRRLGTVQSFFTVNGGVVDLSIKAESAGAASDLKAQMGKLEEFLSGAGLEIGSAEITVEASETPAPDIPEIRQAPRVPLSAYDYLA